MARRPKKVELATKISIQRTSNPLDSDAKTESYRFPEASLLARPEAGQQARFKKRKPKATYRYDSSLAPEMNWDGQNPAREHGEWLIGCIEVAAKLKDTNPPFTFNRFFWPQTSDGFSNLVLPGRRPPQVPPTFPKKGSWQR